MSLQTVKLIEEVKFNELYPDKVVKAKIDTGAYSGALHAEDIKLYQKEDGTYELSFRPLGAPHTITKNDFRVITVTSSNGISEQRFVVRTTITILGKQHKIFISLSDRSDMRYSVIIGRRFLRNKYLVDPKV